MIFKQFALFTFIGAFVLLSSSIAFARAEDDLGDDEFEDDDAFDEGESSEEEEDTSPLAMGDDTETVAPAEEEASGEGLLLTQHTMQFGGMIGISIDVYSGTVLEYNDQGEPVGSEKQTMGGGTFTFAPQAGYFVIDNLEILAELGFDIPFGEANEGVDKSIFFNAGARYIFDFSFLCVYAGGLFGMNFGINDDNTMPSILLSIPAGVLVPFNRHVALDAGMRIIFDIGVGDNSDNFWMHIPIGYFGVEGFFNFFD